jgi:hypothetical protein
MEKNTDHLLEALTACGYEDHFEDWDWNKNSEGVPALIIFAYKISATLEEFRERMEEMIKDLQKAYESI